LPPLKAPYAISGNSTMPSTLQPMNSPRPRLPRQPACASVASNSVRVAAGSSPLRASAEPSLAIASTAAVRPSVICVGASISAGRLGLETRARRVRTFSCWSSARISNSEPPTNKAANPASRVGENGSVVMPRTPSARDACTDRS
jgi:hypothetical protein